MALSSDDIREVLRRLERYLRAETDHASKLATVRAAVDTGLLSDLVPLDRLVEAIAVVDAGLATASSDHDRVATIYWLAVAIRHHAEWLLGAVDQPEAWRQRGSTAWSLAEANRLVHRSAEAIAAWRAAAEAFARAGDWSNLAISRMNAGATLADADRFAEALACYDEAAPLLLKHGPVASYARCRVNMGNALLNLDRPNEAMACYDEAGPLLRQHGLPADCAACRMNEGNALAHIGRTAEAVVAYAEAAPVLLQLAGPAAYARCRLDEGVALADLGRFEEALGRYDEAAPLLLRHGRQAEYAICLMNHGIALGNLGRPSESLEQYRTAAPLLRRHGTPASLGLCHMNEGGALRELGRHAEALARFREATALLEQHGARTDYVRSLANQGAALVDLGRNAEAITTFEAVRAACAALGLAASNIAWRTHHNLAVLRFRAGEYPLSRALAAEALVLTEAVAAQPARPTDRLFVRDAHAETYCLAVVLALHESDGLTAFTRAQQAKGRTLTDLLERGQSAIGDRLLVDLDAREWALVAQLERSWTSGDPALNTQLEAVRAARRTRVAELRDAQPEQALLQAGVPRELAEIADSLSPDEALLDLLDLPSFGFVAAFLVLPGRRMVSAGVIPRPPIIAALEAWEGARIIASSRQGRALAAAGAIEPFEPSLGDADGGLYSLLLAPIADVLREAGIQHLAVSPSGLLHRVPFAALWHMGASGRSRWLSEDLAVSLTPTATSLWLLRQREPLVGPPHLLAIAPFAGPPPYPAMDALIARAAHDECALIRTHDAVRLPGTGTEATVVADLVRRAMGGTAALFGSEATRAAVKERIGGARMVLAATHGFRLDDAVEPLRMGLALADGSVSVLDIFRGMLPLRGTLQVALTACDLGHVAARGDGVLGFRQAFLSAGARVVLAPSWAVDDAATCFLSAAHHSALLGPDRPTVAEAWQAAMHELRMQPGWCHPYFWAAFVPTGDGTVRMEN